MLSTSLLLAAAVYVGVGFVSGIIAGLLGVGGGIVIVPLLFYSFTQLGVPEATLMHMAVGTSMLTIIPTSIASARAHWSRDAVDTGILKSWGPFIFLGVLIGTWGGTVVHGTVLMGVFGVTAILVAANLMTDRAEGLLGQSLPGLSFQRLFAALIGAISAMMGIGGGTLTVPTLVLYAYPIRRAVATASVIGLIISVPAATGYFLGGLGVEGRPAYSLGYLNLVAAALIVPTSILGAPLGAKLAHTIETRWLRRAFAVFLLITSVRMLANIL